METENVRIRWTNVWNILWTEETEITSFNAKNAKEVIRLPSTQKSIAYSYQSIVNLSTLMENVLIAKVKEELSQKMASACFKHLDVNNTTIAMGHAWIAGKAIS